MLPVPGLNPPKHFIVGFFDLVGIGRDLCDLAKCSKIGQGEVDRLGCLAGKVLRFRDDFEKFEEGEQCVTRKFYDSSSDEERDWRMRHQGNPVKVFTFSDTVVAHSSLDIVERQIPLDACSNILMKAAASQLFSLARKTPIRGGIEIGLGIEISDLEVFGASVYEAYRLESKVADWPRIVVGKRLQEYIINAANGRANCDSDLMNQAHARICLDLLRFDHDNVAMLDLLSSTLVTISGVGYVEWLAKARQFVAAELRRFKKHGDNKLADRYSKLSNYLHSDRQ